MHRHLRTPSLLALSALVAGVACYLWQVHDLGPSCGYAPGFGLPSFPVRIALAILVAVPTLLVGTSAVIEHRRPRAVAGFIILTAASSATAFGLAVFAFAVTRHCFE
jgi:hypothetical protein